MLFYESKFCYVYLIIRKLKGVVIYYVWFVLVHVHCSVQVVAAQFSSGPSQEYDKPILKTSIPGPRSKVTS